MSPIRAAVPPTEQPIADDESSKAFGATTPIQHLWERVYGYGPHSDFARVLRVTIRDWGPREASSSTQRTADLGKLLAMMRVIREVIVELHNDVLDIVSGRELGGLDLYRS